jgi:hypothetical protein
MAKATSKTPAKKAANKPVKKAASASKPKPVIVSIEQACESALLSLRALNLNAQLQAELEWCLGSYKADSNPAGLYEMAQRAVDTFAEEKKKKTKGVTAKMISDLDKAIKTKG